MRGFHHLLDADLVSLEAGKNEFQVGQLLGLAYLLGGEPRLWKP
jgi:hypothetical protein